MIRGGMFLIASVFAGLTFAADEKPPFRYEMMSVANGCFVETVALLDFWQERFGNEAWARLMQWGAKEEEEVVIGHAVAVGEHRGRLWCWDINFGWRPVPIDPAQREQAEIVAAPILQRYPRITGRFPLYRVDFPQAADPTPPTAQPSHENPAIRDASIVGERLARRRPVNVVRFTVGSGESKHESAAVIFVFHGRYCIYTPETGTVPFRVRGSVENLRLIQEALRRLVPGAGELRKL